MAFLWTSYLLTRQKLSVARNEPKSSHVKRLIIDSLRCNFAVIGVNVRRKAMVGDEDLTAVRHRRLRRFDTKTALSRQYGVYDAFDCRFISRIHRIIRLSGYERSEGSP